MRSANIAASEKLLRRSKGSMLLPVLGAALALGITGGVIGIKQ
jgi:hypothetical protein